MVVTVIPKKPNVDKKTVPLRSDVKHSEKCR